MKFKKRGGFLNNVDAVITGYQWTDEFNGQPFTPGRNPKTKKEKFHSLYFVPTFRVDGADEDVNSTLFAGAYEDWDVSEDGLTLTPAEDGRMLGDNTGFSTFIQSLVEANFPFDRLPDDDATSYNLAGIVGTRVRLMQRDDPAMTAKGKKRVDEKTGKEYNYQNLVVEHVYELPVIAKSTKGGKTQTASKSTTTAASKTNGKVKEQPTDIAEVAYEALLRYLETAKDTSFGKEKLKVKVWTDPVFKGQTDVRDSVYKYLYNDDYLEGLDNISYSRADSTKLISLDA